MSTEEYDDAEMEKICNSLDWDGFTKLIRSEYKRGFDAGVASVSIDADALKREYERGQNDYRDALLTRIDSLRGTPIAKSIEETKSAGPGRGPKPKDPDRPEGIPSNYEMCRIILTEVGKPMTGSELRDHVKTRWWPDVPHDWKSSPFGFLGSGKLIKDADGKFILPIDIVKPQSAPKLPPQETINREVAKRADPPRPAVEPFKPRVPEEGKKLGAPAQVTGAAFKHGDKTVILHPREATLATMMRSAMGKGHLDAKFLANQIGIKSEAEMTIKEFMAIMNPKIAPLGLTISFYKGFGFSMAEVTA